MCELNLVAMTGGIWNRPQSYVITVRKRRIEIVPAATGGTIKGGNWVGGMDEALKM